MRKICSIEGCERGVVSRGWCKVHYERWHRTGSTELTKVRKPFEQRFQRNGPDECWPWLGHISVHGYGFVNNEDGRMEAAHRWVYEKLVGEIPEGLHIDHTCHSSSDCREGNLCLHRRCVNPAHLEPVTRSENAKRTKGNRRIKEEEEQP